MNFLEISNINDDVYKFKDIVSCKIEKAVSLQKEIGINATPQILLIGLNNNTNMLLSITVWSKSVANEINDLIQKSYNQIRFYDEQLR